MKATEEDETYVDPDITISGRYPSLVRVKTGLFSLDYSLSQEGNLGVPLRVIVELYGYTNVGKSTLSYFLGGVISKELGGNLSIADIEMADTKYIPRAVGVSGYVGNVRLMDVVDEKGNPIPHEKILMQMAKELFKEETGVVIWDSVGATQSMVQMDVLTDPKASFGEAFMGKRAKLVGDVSLSLRTALIAKENPSVAIAINHVHQVIGGRGHLTTGGERLKYLAGVRLMLWNGESFRESDDDPLSNPLGFLVSGQVEKLRFGGKGRKFQFYLVPGYGVHPGVSAMFDAIDNGLAERTKTGYIKLDGKSLGRIKADLLSYAAEGKRRKFYPFQEVMSRFTEDVERGRVQVSETVNQTTEG